MSPRYVPYHAFATSFNWKFERIIVTTTAHLMISRRCPYQEALVLHVQMRPIRCRHIDSLINITASLSTCSDVDSLINITASLSTCSDVPLTWCQSHLHLQLSPFFWTCLIRITTKSNQSSASFAPCKLMRNVNHTPVYSSNAETVFRSWRHYHVMWSI